jgi:predicted nucleic acid-binding Zn ribbon protein
MPLYDFACHECEQEMDDGKSDIILETVVCAMAAIAERPYPSCKRCGAKMKRVYNQMVFGLYQQNKGIFPMQVHNLTSHPVTVESRDDLKRKMKQYDRVELDFSDNARARHRDAVARSRRMFSLKPST